MSSRTYWLLALSVVGIGAAVRFFHLGDWSLWIDEGTTYARAMSGVLNDQGPMYSTAPLNFMLTRMLLSVAPPSEFWLRFVPAVAGCLGVLAVILVGRMITGEAAVGLIGGWLVAIAPWHILWSQNARHFSLVFAAMTMAYGLYFRFWETGRPRHLIAAAVMTGVGLMSHSSAAFVLVAMGVYGLWVLVLPKVRREVVTPRKLVWVAAFFGVILGLYLPIVVMVSQYLAEHKEAWNPPFNVASSAVYYLGPAAVAFGCAMGLFGAVRPDRTLAAPFMLLAVPVLLATTAAFFTISSGVYAISALTGVVILVAYAGVRTWESGSRSFRAAGLGIILAVSADYLARDFQYFSTEHGGRPPWRSAIHWTLAQSPQPIDLYASAGIVAQYYVGKQGTARWLGALPSRTTSGRFWVLALNDATEVSPAVEGVIDRDCELAKVFFANTGPKRRDIVVYRCSVP